MSATATRARTEVAIETVEVGAYGVPTDGPEADGTLDWDSTTLVLVEVRGGGRTGLGWTYGHEAIARVIASKLAAVVEGFDAMQVQAATAAMTRALRNNGRPGLDSMAVSAVDVALWDLKAKLLDLPLADLLGRYREAVPVYGSGGFTSYSIGRLQDQLHGWVEQGIPRVKMKVGSDPARDPARVSAAREAIGAGPALFVDANGAYSRKQALAMSEVFAREAGVGWFEEPVSSDDLEGLRLLRDRAPAAIEIAAGEYGYDPFYFRRMLEAEAVDVLQADVTRCGGVSGLLGVDALCKARCVPFSAHCAPSIHAHACCAMETFVHLEYFHDHARIEQMLFEGALTPERGELRPDRHRPGLGVEFKREDAEQFAL